MVTLQKINYLILSRVTLWKKKIGFKRKTKISRFIRLSDEPKVEDFSEIISKMTEEILSEFIRRRKRHEEEIQKFEEMKHLPGLLNFF
jgi:hypothetical protein